MAEPLHPPYNIITPRQLNRWLDVNSQNGALTRTRGTITIPQINIPFVAFDQVSAKAMQLNFRATRNFSLKLDSTLRTFLSALETNYCVFIVNIFSEGHGNYNSVVRYRLSEVGINFINDTLYIGQQIIGGKFQIEIWNRDVAGGLGFVSPRTVLSTSVLGNLDYRYGLDFDIHSVAPVQVTDFNNTSAGTFDLPLTFNANNINGLN